MRKKKSATTTAARRADATVPGAPGFAFVLALAAFAFCLLPMTAAAQDARADRFRDWMLYRAGGQCLLTTEIASRASGSTIAEVILRPRGDGEPGAAIGVRVPNGVSLSDAIAYVHPERPAEAIGLQWQSCDAERCLAAGTLSEAGLDRLKRGRFIVLGFRPVAGARTLNVDIPLFGVTAGWRALEACAE